MPAHQPSHAASHDHAGTAVKPIALVTGLLLAAATWFLLPDSLAPDARTVAAIAVLMATWWMTEALPIEATGLVPLVAFPLLKVMKVEEAAAPYAGDIIFLFLGGMLLGLAMEVWGLHRRFALAVISMLGTRPSSLIAGFLFASACLSMFVSNAATTVMMLPIGVSVVKWVRDALGDSLTSDEGLSLQRLGPGIVLAIAFGASIGGVGTVIGTPPIAQYAAHSKLSGREFSFVEWLPLGLPAALLMIMIAWVVLTKVIFRISLPARVLATVGDKLRAERAGAGTISTGQLLVFLVFSSAALLWVFSQMLGVKDSVIAIGAALMLFILGARQKGVLRPLLTWKEAERAPWGILLLFGGGLSLAEAIKRSGLDSFIAQGADSLAGVPLLPLLWIISLVTIILTEFTSNTALVAAGLPVGEAMAQRLGIPPGVLLTTITLTASLGFMLPAGTAPNAIVFASGQVTMRQMMKAGFLLDLSCALLVPPLVLTVHHLGLLPGR
jgi:sodium-dependent dicarboxylate transporter 2/3/5